ncbi:MAG: hypothetical protein H0W90_08880 [Actinobacteria bacterium]|nr:hypothetical protein [Actinomycetota bacterium]
MSAGRVAEWERRREEIEERVLRADGPEFAHARSEGSLMSVAEAAVWVPETRIGLKSVIQLGRSARLRAVSIRQADGP